MTVKKKQSKQRVSPRKATTSRGTATVFDQPEDDQTEIVIGLVGPVGAELSRVEEALKNRLAGFGYQPFAIHVSKDVIEQASSVSIREGMAEHERIQALMDAGNRLREKSGNNAVLALGVCAAIERLRSKRGLMAPKKAYIISSLKHPDEVKQLRQVYSHGFYLIGVHSERQRRISHLVEDKRMTKKQATVLIRRDQDERLDLGQKVAETFHLADFFLRMEGDEDRMKQSLSRIVDILFGDPYRTPTFGEYAMFLAFGASLRSADLSRQVGAVIARDGEILATGANDCPKPGGGLYWPVFDPATQGFIDTPEGRDWTRKRDSNKAEQDKIIAGIIKKARGIGLRFDEVRRIEKLILEVTEGRASKKTREALAKIWEVVQAGRLDGEKLRECLNFSPIRDLTEFGRVVHAEMEALLSCARNRMSPVGATLYSTTFPCHNCAKHIIAAGISRVVFVEPYQKSKAQTFHGADAIKVGFGDQELAEDDPVRHVQFEPFVGVGPRRFFDLFSLRLTSGRELKRHDGSGKTVDWVRNGCAPRIQMRPKSYLNMEREAVMKFDAESKGLGNL